MTSSTKGRFEELLQAAADQNSDEKKAAPKKRKTRKKREEQVLEQLKEGADLQKAEDASLLANTYDGTDSPRFRKNVTNERRRKLPPKNGEINKGFEEDEVINTGGLERPRRVKKKSPRKSNLQEKEEKEQKEDDEDTQKRVKKKKRRPKEMTENSLEDKGNEVLQEEKADTKNIDEENEEEENQRKTTKGRKRKKKKNEEAVDEIGSKPIEYEDDGRVMGIYVHRSDRLKADLYIAHPLVRVHVVDINTGAYVKKSKFDRAVTSYYENKNDKLDFILPILTQPFEYKKRKSMIPSWEELLLLNESYLYLTCGKENYPDVVMFFEILDFVSMNSVNGKSHTVAGEGGWHRVAWAFLKVIGSNKTLNTEKKVRLQLFYPPFSFKTKPGQVDVYQWWSSIVRQPYPATLYITIKPVTTPSSMEPAFRSMFATQKEQGRMTYKELKKTLDGRNKALRSDEKNPTNWTRLPGQMCRIPNKLMLSLAGGKKGCFVIKFSHDGRGIVCCCKDKSGYPLVVYDIPSGELRCEFVGHYSIIYDVCWSVYNDELVSASSDGTARIWNLATPGGTASKVFPHPSYVYASRFHPHQSNIVVTGCFDHIVRFWNSDNSGINGELLQELDNHKGLVNCLCFSLDGNQLYSGDSLGTIIVWKKRLNTRATTSVSSGGWQVESIIQERELVGVSINNLCMHPGGKRLLVHGRDNSIRMMDLRINAIIQRYVGALNFREHVRSTLTECGTFVISGSEDCQAYVWNTDTGDQVASYSTLGYHHPVCDVDYHPYDHILALCAYGESHPVQIYYYDSKIAQLDLGLQERPMKAWQDDSTTEHAKESLTTLLQTKQNATMSQDTVKSEKLERAMRKLSTVLAFTGLQQDVKKSSSRATSPAPQSLLNMQMNSTWGSTFDKSSLPTSNFGTPGPFWSPHAALKTSTPATALIQQQSYVKKMSIPSISLQPAQSGSASFKFVSSQTKPAKLHLVVAMYDYTAQRSDELTFSQGSVIKVLHEDNANWWMGEMPDGMQGYFPANYVMEQVLWPPENGEKAQPLSPISDDIDAVLNEKPLRSTPHSKKTKSRRKLSADVAEDEVDGATPSRRKGRDKKVIAIESKDGELNFISGTEDSEQDTPGTSRQRRRKKKQYTDPSRAKMRTLIAADSGSEMSPNQLPPQGKSKRNGSTSRRRLAEAGSEGASYEASPRRHSRTDKGDRMPESGTKRKPRKNHEERDI
ncbi:jouberin-like [Anneissia japonica]|uniref:jouberin-like n=1 Tax=Anneissia japonica TaxID=1529436 RepID=UPI001425B112|nr:jouberin-like [Anneissia japonica]